MGDLCGRMKRQSGYIDYMTLAQRANSAAIAFAKDTYLAQRILALSLSGHEIDHLQQQFPNATIIQTDTLTLDNIDRQSIDLVIASISAMDAYDFEDLLETSMAFLHANGTFIFSVFDDESKVMIAHHNHSTLTDETFIKDKLFAQEDLEFSTFSTHLDFVTKERIAIDCHIFTINKNEIKQELALAKNDENFEDRPAHKKNDLEQDLFEENVQVDDNIESELDITEKDMEVENLNLNIEDITQDASVQDNIFIESPTNDDMDHFTDAAAASLEVASVNEIEDEALSESSSEIEENRVAFEIGDVSANIDKDNEKKDETSEDHIEFETNDHKNVEIDFETVAFEARALDEQDSDETVNDDLDEIENASNEFDESEDDESENASIQTEIEIDDDFIYEDDLDETFEIEESESSAIEHEDRAERDSENTEDILDELVEIDDIVEDKKEMASEDLDVDEIELDEVSDIDEETQFAEIEMDKEVQIEIADIDDEPDTSELTINEDIELEAIDAVNDNDDTTAKLEAQDAPPALNTQDDAQTTETINDIDYEQMIAEEDIDFETDETGQNAVDDFTEGQDEKFEDAATASPSIYFFHTSINKPNADETQEDDHDFKKSSNHKK